MLIAYWTRIRKNLRVKVSGRNNNHGGFLFVLSFKIVTEITCGGKNEFKCEKMNKNERRAIDVNVWIRYTIIRRIIWLGDWLFRQINSRSLKN